MKQQQIGFRDLLERVLPLDELPSVDRQRVQRALRLGLAVEVERAAMRAIEVLEKQGAIKRLPAEVTPGSAPSVRYQTRDQLDVITLQLPGPSLREGVTVVAREALPMQAPARLDQVRRLVRLEDPLAFTDPRTGASRAGLHEQLDEAGRDLLGAEAVRYFARGEDKSGAPESSPLDATLAADALQHHGMLFYCPDTERSGSLVHAARAAGTRSLVVVAVIGGDGNPLGLLEVHNREPEPFRPADLALITLLAEFAGSVLERTARIDKLVFVDPLTSAYNRSYYDLQIRNETARAQRERSSLALLICDIDDFKSFNTSFGYEAGNHVLVQVAAALRAGVRPFDTVARWGGEEFAVLLTPPVIEEDVLAISERLRAAVENAAIRLEGLDGRAHRVNVTVSAGVAMFPDHADNPQDLWRLANQALLLAKRPPKNQIVFYHAQGESRFGTK